MLSGVEWGYVFALGAATCWATAAVLFRRIGDHIPPLGLNLFKGSVALALCGGCLLLGIGRSEAPLVSGGHQVSGMSPGESAEKGAFEARLPGGLVGFSLMLLSGVIGIAVGDTAFFACLNRMGPGRTVLLAETLAPLMAWGLGVILIDEAITAAGLGGATVILLGVVIVLSENVRRSKRRDTPGRANPDDSEENRVRKQSSLRPWEWPVFRGGWPFGVAAAGCQAVGAVMSRGVLRDVSMSAMESAAIRLFGGIGVLGVLFVVQPQLFWPRAGARALAPVWRSFALATLIGTFIAILLQQAALERAPAGIVQTLLATSSLLLLPLAICSGAELSKRTLLGTILSFAGVIVLFSGG